MLPLFTGTCYIIEGHKFEGEFLNAMFVGGQSKETPVRQGTKNPYWNEVCVVCVCMCVCVHVYVCVLLYARAGLGVWEGVLFTPVGRGHTSAVPLPVDELGSLFETTMAVESLACYLRVSDHGLSKCAYV